jgi:SAM-dependent methyltransferase
MDYFWDYQGLGAYNNKTGLYKSKRQLDFILKNNNPAADRILDIAGGAGRFSIPLSRHSKNVTVIDINKKAIELLNERSKDINGLCGDFVSMKVDGFYSLILCIEAIFYFPDWNAFFKKISSLLTSEGVFIFTYTNPNSWRYRLRKLKLRGKPGAYTEPVFSDLKVILSIYNLEISSVEGMNWMPLPVISNSPLVNIFASIEKIFRLNKWIAQSPWLLIAVRKVDTSANK